VTTARRTLRRWILTAFLERGCDPATARVPYRLARIRPMSACELEQLNPLAHSLVPLSNLRRLPRPRAAHARQAGLL
jgi:hypothetical protein